MLRGITKSKLKSLKLYQTRELHRPPWKLDAEQKVHAKVASARAMKSPVGEACHIRDVQEDIYQPPVHAVNKCRDFPTSTLDKIIKEGGEHCLRRIALLGLDAGCFTDDKQEKLCLPKKAIENHESIIDEYHIGMEEPGAIKRSRAKRK